MEWWGILIIVLFAPLMLLPVALIWYINLAGIYLAIKDRRSRTGGASAPVGAGS